MFSTGLIFLITARVILPYFERIGEALGQEEKSLGMLRWGMTILGVMLLAGFLVKLVYRWKGRSKNELAKSEDGDPEKNC